MIQIRDGFENMDFDRVTEMLSKAYWCPGIGKEEVVEGARFSAVNVGAFLGGEQLGYARAVSDHVRFAYLMDVYVDDRYRKQGIGQAMVKHIMGHESLKRVYVWALTTTDAQGVYAKCGFKPLKEPDRWMAIRKPRTEW